MQKHPCMKNIIQTVALHMAERLPLLSHTSARTLRRPYTLAVALTLGLIALSLLAVDARSGFSFSTSLRGSIVSFPNGDLKTITDMIHRASLGNFTAPSMKPGGLFHVEECGDDINNCEEQRGPGGKDFMDDFDTAHVQPRPVRVRGAATHPNRAKAASVPLTSRARRTAKTQQMAATSDDHHK